MKQCIKCIIKQILTVILIFPCLIVSQIPQTPIEVDPFNKNTSHESLLTYIDTLAKLSSKIQVETIGTSVQSRSIPMVHVIQKNSRAKIKVLLFCQQHGNEPSGKEAALILLKKIASDNANYLYPNLDLYIVPSVNPDGNESGKRNNANGADLNRDHLILSQPEVLALHKAFNKIKPEVNLDVHEYAAFRKEFRDAGYFRTADEQFGAPTNLNVSDKIIDYSLNKLFPYLEKELKSKGISFSNYYKMNGPADTVRASTTSIDDGRQSFAIRNSFSFILEGKNGRNMNDELKRRTNHQLLAIETFLSFVNANCNHIQKLVSTEKAKMAATQKPIALQMDYLYDGSKINLPMKTIHEKDTIVSMHFSPNIKVLESVGRPLSYVVPASQTNIIELLDKQGIPYRKVERQEQMTVEIYSIKNSVGKWMENKPTDYVTYTTRVENVDLKAGDVVVPMNNEFALMIAIAFEPASMWGLVQYDQFSYLREMGRDYPIYRVPLNKRKK
jgi:hypothetical protein